MEEHINEELIIFDESACADFIFKRLIEKGIAVRVEDIRTIMDLEYEYGETIGVYPPKPEGPEIIESKTLVIVGTIGGSLRVNCEVPGDEAISLLKEAIEMIRTFE